MEPEYRPFNCITFNCERVEGLMEPLEIERFHVIEQELIAMYKELEALFDNRFMYGLLINCERDLLREKTAILRTTT
jgi:aminoglycoside phosphotransferase family enzyme